ncbi:hypothetical protein ETB97_008412 [Aspergillus alliaceus]|uniref:Xylanolytic transcriptional activator regulatory domain-containing protein n=1 Tax=Petromyces alliaceus TaxID=209559 RepID=A0A8H5ZXQ6_PETAA|nr:hypothetical protein ETB97_008412 [Aspergillus burnettii]
MSASPPSSSTKVDSSGDPDQSQVSEIMPQVSATVSCAVAEGDAASAPKGSVPSISLHEHDKSAHTLPQYTYPTPSQWSSSQRKYLQEAGALTCPPLSLRNALISSYVSWVHPFCPVVDLYNVLPSVVHLDGSHGKISLLLLHSIMFAGASFVPLSELHSAGYDSRLSAKADFYARAKLLYDFGYESDRIRIVQALLLMSYWQDKQDALQNHWYWVALANVVARSIGLHRDPTGDMTTEDIGLWRRLGWTCFVRDRILSLGVRHPPTIEFRQFNLRMLEVTDFGICVLPQEVLQSFPDCEVLQRTETQVSLAQIYIEKLKLCAILDNIFSSKYEEVAPRHGAAKENTVVLLERDLEGPDDTSSQHSARLQKWQHELPSVVQYGASPMRALTQSDGVLRLHQSLLHMLYHTVFLMLYSPREVLNSAPSSSVRRCMRLASSSIAHTMEDLEGHDLVRFLPSASVTMIVNAAVTNVYEYKLARGAHKDWCIRRFLDYIWHLRQLQDVHRYAAFGAEFLVHASRKLRLPIRLSGEPRPFEFGVWEDAHSPGRFLHAHLSGSSNVNIGTPKPAHNPLQPTAPTCPGFGQQLDSPLLPYESGWNGSPWVESSVHYAHDPYDMLFSDSFDTTFPTALLDSWVAEHFQPLVNE